MNTTRRLDQSKPLKKTPQNSTTRFSSALYSIMVSQMAPNTPKKSKRRRRRRRRRGRGEREIGRGRQDWKLQQQRPARGRHIQSPPKRRNKTPLQTPQSMTGRRKISALKNHQQTTRASKITTLPSPTVTIAQKANLTRRIQLSRTTSRNDSLTQQIQSLTSISLILPRITWAAA